MAGDAGDGANRDRQVRSKLTPALASEFSTLKWARSYIQIHSPQSRVEIDRLEADSKFFRSLVVISVALSMYFVFDEKKAALAASALVLGALSYATSTSAGRRPSSATRCGGASRFSSSHDERALLWLNVVVHLAKEKTTDGRLS